MFLTILCGVKGSGKTHLSFKLLSAYNGLSDDLTGYFHPAERMGSDLARAVLYGNGDVQVGENKIKNYMYNRIAMALAFGNNVIFDADNLEPSSRRSVIAIARDRGAIVDAIVLDSPIELCIERDKKSPDPVGEKSIRKDSERFVFPKFEEGFDKITIYHANGTFEEVEKESPYPFGIDR